MQKRTKKLQLRRETLIHLRDVRLTDVQGGLRTEFSCPSLCFGYCDPPLDSKTCQ